MMDLHFQNFPWLLCKEHRLSSSLRGPWACPLTASTTLGHHHECPLPPACSPLRAGLV